MKKLVYIKRVYLCIKTPLYKDFGRWAGGPVAEPGADGSGRWPAKQQMPFAYRPGEARIAVPMASPKGITFRGLKSCVASFRVADVALCDIPTCFMTCIKSFYVAGAILPQPFATVRKPSARGSYSSAHSACNRRVTWRF